MVSLQFCDVTIIPFLREFERREMFFWTWMARKTESQIQLILNENQRAN